MSSSSKHVARSCSSSSMVSGICSSSSSRLPATALEVMAYYESSSDDGPPDFGSDSDVAEPQNEEKEDSGESSEDDPQDAQVEEIEEEIKAQIRKLPLAERLILGQAFGVKPPDILQMVTRAARQHDLHHWRATVEAKTSTASNEKATMSTASNEKATMSTASNEKATMAAASNAKATMSTASNEKAKMSAASNEKATMSTASNEKAPISAASSQGATRRAEKKLLKIDVVQKARAQRRIAKSGVSA